MTEYNVAGHIFLGTCDDRCQKPLHDGSPCPRTWAELECVTAEQVGQHSLAHYSHLTANEFDEIQKEKERRRLMAEHTWQALMGVCAP